MGGRHQSGSQDFHLQQRWRDRGHVPLAAGPRRFARGWLLVFRESFVLDGRPIGQVLFLQAWLCPMNRLMSSHENGARPEASACD